MSELKYLSLKDYSKENFAVESMPGTPMKAEVVIAGCLQRIATAVEKIADAQYDKHVRNERRRKKQTEKIEP